MKVTEEVVWREEIASNSVKRAALGTKSPLGLILSRFGKVWPPNAQVQDSVPAPDTRTAEGRDEPVKTIRQWVYKGLIPNVKINGHLRFDRAALGDWIRQSSRAEDR